jgi:hypothetical protein
MRCLFTLQDRDGDKGNPCQARLQAPNGKGPTFLAAESVRSLVIHFGAPNRRPAVNNP